MRLRYKHIRPPILAALNVLLHDKDISVDDAKARAAGHGVRITAASVSGARTLLEKMDGTPLAAAAPKAPTAAGTPQRRPRPAEVAFDTEALVRGVVAKIQSQGSAEAERLRDTMRKAIAMLQAAVG